MLGSASQTQLQDYESSQLTAGELDLDEMCRKLTKSQSKDQIDERATEFLKHFGAQSAHA